MRLNHECWCEPECTWQTNSINKTATGDRQLGFQTLERYWASFQVTRLFHSATIFFRLIATIFFKLITRMKSFSLFFFLFFFFGEVGGWGVVDSNRKHLYSNEMSDRATHFTVFMIMNCPVEQQILAAYGSIVDSRRTFARVSLYLNYSFRKLRMLTFIYFIRKAHKNA